MNFSKGFLYIFSLAALISTLLIIKDIAGVNKMYFYILVSSSVLAYIFNMYFIYHTMFVDNVNEHMQGKNNKSSKEHDDDSE
jgi:hypothetical protein